MLRSDWIVQLLAAVGGRSAIAALIVAVVRLERREISIVGGVLGLVALSRIKATGESGRGLALAAVIIGFALFAVNVVLGVVIAVHIITTAGGA